MINLGIRGYFNFLPTSYPQNTVNEGVLGISKWSQFSFLRLYKVHQRFETCLYQRSHKGNGSYHLLRADCHPNTSHSSSRLILRSLGVYVLLLWILFYTGLEFQFFHLQHTMCRWVNYVTALTLSILIYKMRAIWVLWRLVSTHVKKLALCLVAGMYSTIIVTNSIIILAASS